MATALTTAAGTALYNSLISGTVPDPIFGTLLLGRGNDTPLPADKVSSIDKRIPIQLTASPVRNHPDVRNPGRGADVFTWAFDISAPSTPWLATNVALGQNSLETDKPLAIHASDDILGDPYRRVLVWLNLGNGSSTVYHLHVTDPAQAAKLRSSGARADVLFGGPGSQVLRVGEVNSTVRAGESASLRGRLYGEDGLALRPSDVQRVTRHLEEYEGGSNRWVSKGTRILDNCLLGQTSAESSALFPYRGGFNFSATLPGRETVDGVNKRLTYKLQLSDGNLRVIRQTVRVLGA